MRILDLGCGTDKVRSAIGMDRVILPAVDVVGNLADPRFPFADNVFDEIYLNDVIEHLPDTIATMEAVYRVAKPDSKVFIRVVNWNCHYTAMDPTHLKAFTQNTFDFFGKHHRTYYSHARFDVLKCGLQYNVDVERRLRSKKLLRFLSRYLCNVLEGLNFELKTLKTNPEARLAAEDDGSLQSILRCPNCASLRVRGSGPATGRLLSVNDSWLACQEIGCQRKYPVYRGVPILLAKEAEQWIRTAPDDLPREFPPDLAGIFPPASLEPLPA